MRISDRYGAASLARSVVAADLLGHPPGRGARPRSGVAAWERGEMSPGYSRTWWVVERWLASLER